MIDPAAVMPGAEPFEFPGSGPNGRTGVLLVHGFTGTPMSMRPWGEALAAEGFTVRCPLLPGHGTRWQDCNQWTEEHWSATVAEEFDRLAKDVDRVVVAGLSMGGTLAIRLAELRPNDVAGLVLVNPSLVSLRPEARIAPVVARLTPVWMGIASDIKKPGITEPAYARLPTRAGLALSRLWTLTRADLAKVTTPIQVFRSVEDHIVEPLSVQLLKQGVSSTDVTEVLLENSYHVATLDHDAPLIFEQSAAWIREHAGVADPSPPVEQA